MSSLIFYTDETQALVATDTLAVNYDGSPMFFSSKAQHLPHLKLIIAGTGAGGFACNWTSSINSRMLVRGIEHLDIFSPGILRELWNDYRNNTNAPPDLTTTVYHFGVSETTGTVCSFAYRSTNDFSSERLSYGTGVKPECKVLDGNIFENLREMMQEQREIQESKPKSERIYIGGEAYAFHLTPNSFTSVRAFSFDDFEEQAEAAYKNFEAAR